MTRPRSDGEHRVDSRAVVGFGFGITEPVAVERFEERSLPDPSREAGRQHERCVLMWEHGALIDVPDLRRWPVTPSG